MRLRLAAIVCEVVGECLRAILLGCRSRRLNIGPQVSIVLDIEAAAVERMSAVGCTHDCVSAGYGGGPGVTADLFIGYHPFDLYNRTVCRPVQEQVEPTRPAQVLNIAVSVGRGGMQQGKVRFDRRDGNKDLSPERIVKNFEVGIHLRELCAYPATPG